MRSALPFFDPTMESINIIGFISKTFAKQRINKAVIGISGGVDSMTSLYLLKDALKSENIIIAHLYADKSYYHTFSMVFKKLNILPENIYHLPIEPVINVFTQSLSLGNSDVDLKRIGNIAARIRMIFLYDLAKKYNALVCGTENKSENLLGYFTRYGDQASDIEPIEHLYKTQVYKLAEYLGVPENILLSPPTAGLWKGQTDEGQFGFTYEEADQVLYLNHEKKYTSNKLEKMGFTNAKKILEWKKQNSFKHNVPYVI